MKQTKTTKSIHDRKCEVCKKPFHTKKKPGRPFRKCPSCR